MMYLTLFGALLLVANGTCWRVLPFGQRLQTGSLSPNLQLIGHDKPLQLARVPLYTSLTFSSPSSFSEMRSLQIEVTDKKI